MKYLGLILLILLSISCTDPTSVDADREKILIDDPSKSPPKFEVNPSVIDFGEILIDTQNSIEFSIKNLTDSELIIANIQLKNYKEISRFIGQFPIVLKSKGIAGDNQNVELKFTPNIYGYFADTISFDNFKTPLTLVKATIPALYADDINFSDTRISEFQLELFKFKNISDKQAIITDFELIDENNVFINEPKVQLPLNINPNSESNDIKLTFNPSESANYQAEIRITANFVGANYPFRRIIKIKGKGI